MKNWLYPKGAKYDKVKIVTQKKGYRGAIATKSIRVIHKITIEKRSHRLHTEIIASFTLDGSWPSHFDHTRTKANRTSFTKAHTYVFTFARASFFGENIPIPSLYWNFTDWSFMFSDKLLHWGVNWTDRIHLLVSDTVKGDGPKKRLWCCLLCMRGFLSEIYV